MFICFDNFFRNIAFFAGSILAVLVILVVYDEDVLTVEHVLTTTTILGNIDLFFHFKGSW